MSASDRLYKRSQRLPKRQPLSWRVYFREVVARDGVLWLSVALAALSGLVSGQPAAAYPGYMDWKTLACLFSLMAASGGFMILGVFDAASARLAARAADTRSLLAAMTAATFLASMFITNDVALIVLVPLTLLAYGRAGHDPMPAVILQTVAANVGSALMPMGNPQNLFLYSRFHMDFPAFFAAVLPIGAAGAVLLAAFCLLPARMDIVRLRPGSHGLALRPVLPYAALFAAVILAVFDVVDYRPVFAAAAALALWKGRILLQQIDFALLATFVGFFIFVGNIAAMAGVRDFLYALVTPNPFLAAALASQVISNVPAAVLLAGFTDDAYALLAGVSAGGCGTLIASMASLISYKLYTRAHGNRKKYLLRFTLINAIFLVSLSAAWMLTASLKN